MDVDSIFKIPQQFRYVNDMIDYPISVKKKNSSIHSILKFS